MKGFVQIFSAILAVAGLILFIKYGMKNESFLVNIGIAFGCLAMFIVGIIGAVSGFKKEE